MELEAEPKVLWVSRPTNSVRLTAQPQYPEGWARYTCKLASFNAVSPGGGRAGVVAINPRTPAQRRSTDGPLGTRGRSRHRHTRFHLLDEALDRESVPLSEVINAGGVLDELVGPADAHDGCRDILFAEQF